jgi:hypothetical protein
MKTIIFPPLSYSLWYFGHSDAKIANTGREDLFWFTISEVSIQGHAAPLLLGLCVVR